MNKTIQKILNLYLGLPKQNYFIWYCYFISEKCQHWLHAFLQCVSIHSGFLLHSPCFAQKSQFSFSFKQFVVVSRNFFLFSEYIVTWSGKISVKIKMRAGSTNRAIILLNLQSNPNELLIYLPSLSKRLSCRPFSFVGWVVERGRCLFSSSLVMVVDGSTVEVV